MPPPHDVEQRRHGPKKLTTQFTGRFVGAGVGAAVGADVGPRVVSGAAGALTAMTTSHVVVPPRLDAVMWWAANGTATDGTPEMTPVLGSNSSPAGSRG